jgi:hypothetical protein
MWISASRLGIRASAAFLKTMAPSASEAEMTQGTSQSGVSLYPFAAPKSARLNPHYS